MFERFTDEARAVVYGAREQAKRLGHGCVEPEHLLLALVSADTDVAGVLRGRGVTPERIEPELASLSGGRLFDSIDRNALAVIGIDLDHVRRKVEEAFGPGALQAPPVRTRRWRMRRRRRRRTTVRPGFLPFSGNAKKCLELALREALALHSRQIGAEHIALGLTRPKDGPAARILDHLGVSVVQLHGEIADRYRRAG